MATLKQIDANRRNGHRSLKALQALEPPSEEPVQLEEPKDTSGKLALFREKHSEPEPGPTEPPGKATSSDSCLLSTDSSSPAGTSAPPAPAAPEPQPQPGPTESPEKATPSDSCLLSPGFPSIFPEATRNPSDSSQPFDGKRRLTFEAPIS